MSTTRAAVVLGASGSVGNALIRELIRTGAFTPIVTLVRRSQPQQVAMARDAGVELRETLVPARDPVGLETATTEAIRSLEGSAVGFSVLGVGAGTSKLTIEEHRAVDVDLNAAFARGLKTSGRVNHLAFMSLLTSITVEQIAKAMIATSLSTPARSDVYHYPEMMALNR